MKCRHGLDIYEMGPRDSGYPCSCCEHVEVDPLRSGFLCVACFRIEHALAAPAEVSRACAVRLAPTLESVVAGVEAIAPDCQTDLGARCALVLARQAVALCEEARGDARALREAMLRVADGWLATDLAMYWPVEEFAKEIRALVARAEAKTDGE